MSSWAATIKRSQSASPVPALSLYAGNHWSTAKEILRTTENLELWVISAGLGFLNSRDLVDAYEATFHDLPGFVNGMVASHLLCHSGTINRHSLNGALLS
ncbi:hypothetical protein ACMV6A_27420 [Klebsiella pneumoniae]|uniref:hypothetical protein n=1 Tax=Klebsiella pneumoniae TaxID=573 RepID=UPI0039E11413